MPQERIDGSSSSTAGETAAAATYAIPPSLKSTSPCVPPPERPRATKEKIHQPAHPLAAASPTPPPRIHPRVPLPPFPFVTSPCLSSTRSAAPQLLAPGPSRHLVSSSRPRRTGCRYTQLASQSVTQPEPKKQAPRRAGPATPQGRGEKSIMQNKHQHPSPQPQPVDLPGREARMDLWLVLCCLGFALAPMFAVAGACACR
ncbi:hypothetical protein BKA80DRAFT_47963 [Phyllosticta citrichinensis]